MTIQVLNDFVQLSTVDEPLIEKYTDKLPSEIISLWREYGFGEFMDGYLKVINPDDYLQLLKDFYWPALSERDGKEIR